MNGSAALDNFPCPCCMVDKRMQTVGPLAPSVNYGWKFAVSVPDMDLTLWAVEIILRPLKSRSAVRTVPKMNTRQRVLQTLLYTLFCLLAVTC